MKIAILAAGKSDYFPVFIDKPKCLYHLNGKVQLERVIESCSKIVGEENLIVVAGYKSSYISKFLKKYPKIELRLNQNYSGPAIYSYREAAKNSTEDIVFLCADESISEKNIKRICDSKNKMALLCHDKYYFYSVGIFKLRYDQLGILFDDKYLDMERMKEIYCFANKKTRYDGSFNINSGICLGYMVIDFVRNIANIDEIVNPATYTVNLGVDFLHYNPSAEYIEDLDFITDTDEYKNNVLLRIYNNTFSRAVKAILRRINK